MDKHFTKAERLNGKKEIKSLFDNGARIFSFPYRSFWRFVDQEKQNTSASILISISKRGFKKAVDRNQIKRYIKEAYRLQKNILLEEINDRQMQIAILYIGKEVEDFHFHEKAINKLLRKLVVEAKIKP